MCDPTMTKVLDNFPPVSVLEQLDGVGWENVSAATEDFSEATLAVAAFEDDDQVLCLTLAFPPDFPTSPPEVRSIDLPDGEFSFPWDKSSSLTDLFDAFQERVRAFAPVLGALREFDRSAWVLDPAGPASTTRRIVLQVGVTAVLDFEMEAGQEIVGMPEIRRVQNAT